jgi:uncharacterized membrane protein YdjX (TVP38/TMEM64 family)
MVNADKESVAARFSQPLLYSVAGTILVGVVLTVLFYFDIDQKLLSLLQWIEDLGSEAAVIFVVIMAAVVIFLLPGVLFTWGAGFVFGLISGTVYVVVGTTFGAVIAFLISRYLLGDKAKGFIQSHAKIKLVNESLAEDGLRVVTCIRLIPFFPSKLANYVFGLTPVKLRDYSLGTAIGIIPFSLHNVYLGSITSDLVSLGTRTTERTPAEWAAYGVGMVLILAAVIGLGRFARRALSGDIAQVDAAPANRDHVNITQNQTAQKDCG